MSRKISFWSVFALVTGNQIGSAVFMLPSILAPYGVFGLLGWLISGLGAISLALVFAKLCSLFPKTGGAHVYVKQAFGMSAGFFVGWTYWIVCWICTTGVIITSVGYLMPCFHVDSPIVRLMLEVFLLLLITIINLKGVRAAGHIEFLLTLFKIVPLILIPLAAFFFFNKDNISTEINISQCTTSQTLRAVTLLTFWGFIGLEAVTTVAGSVENPSKTIPFAIVIGTVCVTVLYFFNHLSIMGTVSAVDLIISDAPYADSAHLMFGGNWHLILSLMASVICICTLNACILTCGQISLGLGQDGFIPKIFTRKNQEGAPFCGLIVSSLGIFSFLTLTMQKNMAQQISIIIDFSVISFLFVYAICCLALLKLLVRTEKNYFFWFLCGMVAFLFCAWVVYETPVSTVIMSGLFTLSGLPVYIIRYSKFNFIP